MHDIVIIGGGPGGTITANHLADELGPELQSGSTRITLLTDKPDQVYKPGFLYMALGLETAEAIHRPVRELVSPLVDVRIEPVTKVDTAERKVITRQGRSYRYDQLIIATGTRLDPEATPGLKEAGDTFYDEAGAQRLYEKLSTLTEGRIVVSVIGVPHMCPVAPLEITFMLDEWLRDRGVRDRIELTYTYPINRSHSIETVAAWATPELASRGVGVETFFNAESVDPDAKTIASMEGTELDYDLLVTIPPHAGIDLIEEAGLGDRGWVEVNKHTLEAEGADNVYALGDAAATGVPKAGSVAHYQAATVGQRLASEVRGQVPTAAYDGKTICFIETGMDSASFVEFDYQNPPSPVTPSEKIHWSKLAYNESYWLTARGLI